MLKKLLEKLISKFSIVTVIFNYKLLEEPPLLRFIISTASSTASCETSSVMYFLNFSNGEWDDSRIF